MLNKIIKWLAAILFYLVVILVIRELFFMGKDDDEGFAEGYGPEYQTETDSLQTNDEQVAIKPVIADPHTERVEHVHQSIDLSRLKAKGNVGPIEWQNLEDVTYQVKWYEGTPFEFPDFGDSLVELNGKNIEITGFLIPASHTGTIDALSKMSYAQCFFCTGGGRASVMQVYFKKAPDLPLDALVTLKGTLWLNAADTEKLDYLLDDAEVVKIHD